MEVEILGIDAKIPVEKEKQLLLHQIDLGDRETEALVAANSGVPGPVLVLWGRVVQVLSRKNERGEEDAVDSARHSLSNRRKSAP